MLNVALTAPSRMGVDEMVVMHTLLGASSSLKEEGICPCWLWTVLGRKVRAFLSVPL